MAETKQRRADVRRIGAPAFERNDDGEYDLDGRLKAAIMLLALPDEMAVEVMQRLDAEEAEALAIEAANLDFIPRDAVRQVIFEFEHHTEAFQFVPGRGVRRVTELVNSSLAQDVAVKVTGRVLSDHQPPPFRSLAAAPITQAVEFLRQEHPQTIALVLAHVRKDLAAMILSELPEDLLKDVALRICQMETSPPDVLQALDEQIRIRMAPSEEDLMVEMGIDGLKRLVDILNSSPRTVEQLVLDHLEQVNDDLYNEVRKAMFVFEDLILLDGRSVQRLLREIDSNDLILALKAASDELKDLFFGNMSERAALILKEDMQFSGPVRVRDVHEAQQRIINATRNLEMAGEIVIPRGSGDALI